MITQRYIFLEDKITFEWALRVYLKRHVIIPLTYFQVLDNVCWQSLTIISSLVRCTSMGPCSWGHSWLVFYSIWGVRSAIVRLVGCWCLSQREVSMWLSCVPTAWQGKGWKSVSIGLTWDMQKRKRKWVIYNSLQEDHWYPAERSENDHLMSRGS